MEPIITSLAVYSLLKSLATKGLDKAFEKGGEKVSEGAINWIKSLFFKENKPKKILEDLQENPDNTEKLTAAKAIIENSIEDNPQFKDYFKELVEKVSKNETTITSSKNVNTGNVNTQGGNFRIGDNYGK